MRRHTAHALMGGVGRTAVEQKRRHLLIIIGSRQSRAQFPLQPGKSTFAPAASPRLMVGTLTPNRAGFS
jgi:hypothetical protein